MRKNKGITLIALILTIVIMLILLAVGASYIINDNLIGRADNTVKAANNKINQQQTKVDDLMGEFDKYSVAHDWKYTDETRAAMKCVCDDCKEFANSTEGRTLYIGQQIMYTSTGTGSSSISAEKAGGYVGTTGALRNTLKVASTKLNGNILIGLVNVKQPTTTQTITADSDTKWVIFGCEDKNKDGTNETLLLTTLKPIGSIILYGAAAYNNGPEEINRMCKELYGNNARSITIEDVNECLGYTNQTGMYYGTSSKDLKILNNLTTQLKDLPEDVWNAIKDNHQTPDERNTEDALGKYQLNCYWYRTYSTSAINIRKNLINVSSNDFYWMASRSVHVNAYTASAYFGMGAVVAGNVKSCNDTFRSNGSNEGQIGGLRPIVSITSKIPESGEILVSSDDESGGGLLS